MYNHVCGNVVATDAIVFDAAAPLCQHMYPVNECQW